MGTQFKSVRTSPNSRQIFVKSACIPAIPNKGRERGSEGGRERGSGKGRKYISLINFINILESDSNCDHNNNFISQYNLIFYFLK